MRSRSVALLKWSGDYTAPGMEIEIALRKHDLPHQFPPEVEKLSAKLPDAVQKKDLKEREDLRHLPLVTIDGETARDFDDAVYCERDGKGYKLYVAIADVSHYVLSSRCARSGGVQSRQFSLFSTARYPDVAGSAFQWVVFTQSASGSFMHGMRDESRRQRAIFGSTGFYPAVMSLPCPAYLYQSGRDAGESKG